MVVEELLNFVPSIESAAILPASKLPDVIFAALNAGISAAVNDVPDVTTPLLVTVTD